MIDKRVGKRRLSNYILEEKEHQVIKELYTIPCNAEEMEINSLNHRRL